MGAAAQDGAAARFTEVVSPLSIMKLRCALITRQHAARVVSGSACHTRAAASQWASLTQTSASSSPPRTAAAAEAEAHDMPSPVAPSPTTLPVPLPLPPTTELTDRHSVEVVDDADGEWRCGAVVVVVALCALSGVESPSALLDSSSSPASHATAQAASASANPRVPVPAPDTASTHTVVVLPACW